MRVVAEVPHSHFKITIFLWNAKFQIKVELDNYEQTYKINEADVSGVEEVKKVLDEEFLTSCMRRFLSMREDFSKSFNKLYTNGK